MTITEATLCDAPLCDIERVNLLLEVASVDWPRISTDMGYRGAVYGLLREFNPSPRYQAWVTTTMHHLIQG